MYITTVACLVQLNYYLYANSCAILLADTNHTNNVSDYIQKLFLFLCSSPSFVCHPVHITFYDECYTTAAATMRIGEEKAEKISKSNSQLTI